MQVDEFDRKVKSHGYRDNFGSGPPRNDVDSALRDIKGHFLKAAKKEGYTGNLEVHVTTATDQDTTRKPVQPKRKAALLPHSESFFGLI